MFTLEVIAGGARGRTFEIDAAGGTVGRGSNTRVALPDAHLSTEHGQLFREDDVWVYRDLRSTNGSRLVRGGEELVLDGSRKWEVALRDGDQLLLGDPADPVILRCVIKAEDVPPSGDGLEGKQEVIAQRGVAELHEVQGKVERDPERGAALYAVLYAIGKKMGRRGLDLQAVFESVAEAVFELLPRATHVAIDLSDQNDGRMHTVYARSRSGKPDERVQASRAVVRRVQKDKAALLVSNAPADLGSESVMKAQILSILGVPLWDGETIRGVLQCDNRDGRGFFVAEDLDLCSAMAPQVTLAIENARLVQRLRLAEEKLRGEVKYLKGREEKRRFADIIGDSSAMREVFKQVDKVIDTRATVCIEGETGTGKEVIASAIHYQGRRRDKLFVAQNCAAMPENLLESELFGHKKGAFTGADHEKKGLFEIADGGTLFLDEIGEMPLNLQAKLLRVLQEGEIRQVGATQAKAVDVRIICATNRSLEAEVAKGAFRQDLFYRLRVFPLRLPALRERREDVPLLVEHFLRKYTTEMNKAIAGVTPEALDQLSAYNWPGNIRELENEVQRLVIQADPGGFITPELLAPAVRKVEGLVGRVAPKKGTLKDMMEEVERWLLQEALRDHQGNKTKTAETLGITREGLHKKLSKYGM
jgi:transcriptional regulator with GAF, ATPase, and Fis domain